MENIALARKRRSVLKTRHNYLSRHSTSKIHKKDILQAVQIFATIAVKNLLLYQRTPDIREQLACMPRLHVGR